MPSHAEKAERFLALHAGEQPLLLPNAWDEGSARILASLGFEALATTSAGFAATRGRLDYGVTREEALEHCALLAAATDLPLSADLEDGFARDPEGVAETVNLARAAGLAGCSIEDFTGDRDDPIHPLDLAVERVAAAAHAAHTGAVRLVLTARAEGWLHGRRDLEAVIARLQAFGDAGADCLYAPGITGAGDIGRLVRALGQPVNVLALPGGPTVPELAAAGVQRVSVGGAFAFAALGALVEAARELREQGTLGFWDRAQVGGKAARSAFAGEAPGEGRG